ncbi:MAG: MerR family transcriptional regulator [Pseudomonadota bacterium]
MRIGELAKRADVSRDTIRFYERHGLISSSPSEVTSNSYRDYPDSTLEVLSMIREAQNAGFSIADLTFFLSEIGTGSGDPDAVEAFLNNKIAEVEESIARASSFLSLLKQTRDSLDAEEDESNL